MFYTFYDSVIHCKIDSSAVSYTDFCSNHGKPEDEKSSLSTKVYGKRVSQILKILNLPLVSMYITR